MNGNWHEEDNHHENDWQRGSGIENAHDDQHITPGGVVSYDGWRQAADHEEEDGLGAAGERQEAEKRESIADQSPKADVHRDGAQTDSWSDQEDDQRGDAQRVAADAQTVVREGNQPDDDAAPQPVVFFSSEATAANPQDGGESTQGPYSGYSYDDEEEEIDLDRYEIARPEFFAHLAEPTFTVNVDKVSVNAASVRLFADVDYVEIMVDREEKKVLLFPCEAEDYSAYNWVKVKNGRRYSRHRAGEEFVLMLCELMEWNPDYRYQILGKRARAKGKKALSFDLNVYKCYEKVVTENGKRKNRSFMHMDSAGRFGPTYAESKRSLEIKTFDRYTVITVNKKRGKKSNQHGEDQQVELTQKAGQKPEGVSQILNVNTEKEQPEVQQDE